LQNDAENARSNTGTHRDNNEETAAQGPPFSHLAAARACLAASSRANGLEELAQSRAALDPDFPQASCLRAVRNQRIRILDGTSTSVKEDRGGW
jgi:hypothetical protein